MLSLCPFLRSCRIFLHFDNNFLLASLCFDSVFTFRQIDNFTVTTYLKVSSVGTGSGNSQFFRSQKTVRILIGSNQLAFLFAIFNQQQVAVHFQSTGWIGNIQ